jgi:hypothetical protein
VVLYDHGCGVCRAAAPTFDRKAREGERIAMVEMPPYAPADDELIPPSSPCLRAKLADRWTWFATTPVVMKVRDGIVISAATGEHATSK